MKISCAMTEDLLPLYVDGVCSEESKNAVTAHLQQCPKCRRLAGVEVAVPQVQPDVPKADRAVKKGLKKIRTRWWASILTLLALIPVLFLGWNEYSAQGVAYSNLDELRISDMFMQCLVDGDYGKAYRYLDVESKKQTWLENWFDEEKLANMETDGLEKFCELGEKLEQQLGGFESYEYVGTSKSYKLVESGDEERFVVDQDGSGRHQVTYRIRIGGKEQIFIIEMNNKKVQSFSGGGSFWTDPLAQFCAWGEYLWQDYEGCYYDTELRTYVYYDGRIAKFD